MTFPYRSDIRLALNTMRATKLRSFLTVLGIVIGIVAAVTAIAIADGVKHQVSGQLNQLGKNLITIRPGQLINRNRNGSISSVNLFSTLTNISTLTQNDEKVVKDSANVADSTALTIVSGTVTVSSNQKSSDLVVGADNNLLRIIDHSVSAGEFFNSDTENKNVAVIGSQAATKLFDEDVPLGHTFSFHGQQFIVLGILGPFDNAPLSINADFNNAIFIPNSVANVLTNNTAPIYQILAKPNSDKLEDAAYKSISANLTTSHGGQADFTVLKQSEGLAVTNGILNILSLFIAGIASISLLVGGIGIMNVMLVSVSERTHEIGLRKAIGATSRQILNQFIIEAGVLSFAGGVSGIILSFIADYLIRVFTTLTPIITWQVLLVATIVSMLIGLLFGAIPAAQAARKDPIVALRHE